MEVYTPVTQRSPHTTLLGVLCLLLGGGLTIGRAHARHDRTWGCGKLMAWWCDHFSHSAYELICPAAHAAGVYLMFE
jgi:hypothetical protein